MDPPQETEGDDVQPELERREQRKRKHKESQKRYKAAKKAQRRTQGRDLLVAWSAARSTQTSATVDATDLSASWNADQRTAVGSFIGFASEPDQRPLLGDDHDARRALDEWQVLASEQHRASRLASQQNYTSQFTPEQVGYRFLLGTWPENSATIAPPRL
jgi:hypothetical protein